MVNVCMEIECTRDIARQILFDIARSASKSSVSVMLRHLDMEYSEVRLQDEKNRQNSLPTQDRELQRWWDEMQRSYKQAQLAYGAALNNGIAKEVARKVLPEGLTNSRMYMNGTLRSWMHYVDIRCDEATQKEHREVADQCKAILTDLFPSIYGG
jgi:thymidylate synthase (FAD)